MAGIINDDYGFTVFLDAVRPIVRGTRHDLVPDDPDVWLNTLTSDSASQDFTINSVKVFTIAKLHTHGIYNLVRTRTSACASSYYATLNSLFVVSNTLYETYFAA